MDRFKTGMSSPNNLWTPLLGSIFINRHAELEAISRAFQRDAVRGIVIVGIGGVGKTALARQFAKQRGGEFSSRIYATHASPAESIEDMLHRVLPEHLSGPSLLIIDDAEAFDDTAVKELETALQRYPMLRVVLTSRRRWDILPFNFRYVELGGLRRFEFDALLEALNPSEVTATDAGLEKLFQQTGGLPLIAQLASSAVQQHAVPSWEELSNRLRPFRTPGLVGPDGRPLSKDSPEFGRIIVDVSSTNSEIVKRLKNDPSLAWTLPSRKFEEIVAEILNRQGYDVTLTPASKDGGFDIYAARKEGLGKFLYLVECKRFVPPNKVGVEIVRSLYGVLQSRRATAGAIVTTSYFTAGAEEFQREVPYQLQLHDYLALQEWIRDFPLDRR